MILHRWGVVPYEKAREEMRNIHMQAQEDGQNHLILTQHPSCFTVGRDHWSEKWNIPVIQTDRGGSITCHSEGQNIYYFCFQAQNPVKFFQKVKNAFSHFFDTLGKPIYYDKEHPGFYIAQRKLCSLGFRYKNGVSCHGVALNVNVDLNFHNQVNPCALKNIKATSLKEEGIHISTEDVNNIIITEISRAFHDPV
jgi:lipoyl(octanoyl) transferase